MPTPNWGPQNGVPMDQATFDAYVSSNPPGTPSNNVFWGGRQPGPAAPAPAPAMPGPSSTTGDDFWSQFYQNGPASVQMPGFQTGNQDQARLQQQQVIQDLQRSAAGDPNSQAQQQLTQSYGDARNQQSSLASTMRGQSAGAAMRGAQQGQENIQRGYAGDQQMLQLQEQQAAQQMLAQLLAQQQGQDITQAQGMASGSLQGDALNQAMAQFYAQQGANFDTERGQIASERNNAQMGFDLQGAAINNQLLNQGVQAAATAAGTYGQTGWGQSGKKKIDDAFNGG